MSSVQSCNHPKVSTSWFPRKWHAGIITYHLLVVHWCLVLILTMEMSEHWGPLTTLECVCSCTHIHNAPKHMDRNSKLHVRRLTRVLGRSSTLSRQIKYPVCSFTRSAQNGFRKGAAGWLHRRTEKGTSGGGVHSALCPLQFRSDFAWQNKSPEVKGTHLMKGRESGIQHCPRQPQAPNPSKAPTCLL